MKKTLKNQDVPFFINTKSNKKQSASPSTRQPQPTPQINSQRNQRQVKVVCPNCQFHFKIEPKLIQDEENVVIYSRKKDQDSLQKLIEKQYSLISSFSKSKSGPFIQNAPVVKFQKNSNIIQDPLSNELTGLQRLQRLNQINQMQKNRLQASRATIRFNPSPSNSPPEEYQQKSLQVSPITNRQSLQSPQIKLFQRQPQPVARQLFSGQSRLEGGQRQMIQSTIFDYFQAMQALTATIDWVISNQHYKQLPYYLKLLIDSFQFKRNLKV